MKTPETLAELFDRGAIISGSKYLTVEKLSDGRVTIRANIPSLGGFEVITGLNVSGDVAVLNVAVNGGWVAV